MPSDQIKAFQQALRADSALQHKLDAAEDIDAIVAVAAAAGFTLSANELRAVAEELSEEALDTCVGGTTSGFWHLDDPADTGSLVIGTKTALLRR